MDATKIKHRLLTPKEVARYCRVDLMTVYRWLNAGKLQGVKAGSVWRVRRRVLAEFLKPKPAVEPAPPIALSPTLEERRRRLEAAKRHAKALGL